MYSNLRIFRDPVHDIIALNLELPEERMVFDLLNTQEMQRLRRISQLGVSSLTYPGATHTRFLHSLGTFHLCRRISQHLENLRAAKMFTYLSEDSQDSIDQLSGQRTLLYAAAILHDIGHGPFSHALENITGISHETWTKRIVTERTAIREILEDTTGGKMKICPEDIAKVIDRRHENVMLVKLISSQLDADRLDYLVRDSYMTGVKYGSIDLEWLLMSLRVGEIPGSNEPEIGLDAGKGLDIAESLVFARHYMYGRVYFHKATRGIEVLIKNILRRAQNLFDTHELEPLTFGAKCVFDLTLDNFLTLDESCLWSSFAEWACNARDPILKDLCSKLLKRKLMKAISFDYDTKSAMRYSEHVTQKKEALKLQNLNPVYYSGSDNVSVNYYKNPFFRVRRGGIGAEASEQMFLIGNDGKALNLAEKSRTVKQVSGDDETIERFYYDRRADD
jgi:HD superfamily phosphohydrolase